MALQWSDELSVSEVIDEQHKGVFKAINDLLSAMIAHQGKQEALETLAFCKKYIASHFEAEEKLMIGAAYRDYTQHKIEHLKFVKDYDAIEKEVGEKGMNSYLTVKIKDWLCNWIITHI